MSITIVATIAVISLAAMSFMPCMETTKPIVELQQEPRAESWDGRKVFLLSKVLMSLSFHGEGNQEKSQVNKNEICISTHA